MPPELGKSPLSSILTNKISVSRVEAFTLVEMLLVFLLIGVLAGSVVVSFAGRQEREALRTSAEDLAAALRYAAQQANIEGTAYRVALYDSSSRYRVEAGRGATLEFVPARGRAGRWKRVVKGVRISGVSRDGSPFEEPPNALLFDPGRFEFAGRIKLVNEKDEERYIEILPETGLVDVLDRRVEE